MQTTALRSGRRLRACLVLLAGIAMLTVARSSRLNAQSAVAKADSSTAIRVDRSGPRLGIVILDSRAARKANISQLTTLFGWQAETDFAAQSNGASGVSALIAGVSGVEQRTFLPTINWLIGFRTAEGFEAGLGPSVSADGAALAMTVGVTTRQGGLAMPFNVAVVPGATGVRVSFTMGFNTTK